MSSNHYTNEILVDGSVQVFRGLFFGQPVYSPITADEIAKRSPISAQATVIVDTLCADSKN